MLLTTASITVQAGTLATYDTRNLVTGEDEMFQVGVGDGNVVMTIFGADTRNSFSSTVTEAIDAAASAQTQSNSNRELVILDRTVFNNGLQTVWFYDSDGSVQKMNHDEVKKMVGGPSSVANSQNMKNAMAQQDAMMAEVHKGIANLSRADQEKLRELGIPGLGGGETPSYNQKSPTSYRNNGEQETVEGYPTKGVDEYEGDNLTKHYWVIPWSLISNEFLESFENLDAFNTSMIEAAGGAGTWRHVRPTPFPDFAALGGLPAKIIEVGPDGEEAITVLKRRLEEHPLIFDGATVRY